MTKRDVLPREFGNFMEEGDIDRLKAVFQFCDINAKGGYDRMSALGFSPLTDEFAHWLVSQGADLNAKDDYGKTPLHAQTQHWKGNPEILLCLGADINAGDKDGNTPLHIAAGSFRTKSVSVLLKYKVGVNIQNKDGRTALETAMIRCANKDICDFADIAAVLLDAGALVPKNTQERIRRIGKEFEFYKDAFNRETFAETQNALRRLYSIFSVIPVEERIYHDGISPILVTSSGWKNQHQELWDYLVPASGAAATVQGEVIRITGKIAYELLDNGGINWDREYAKVLNALPSYFSMGKPLSLPDKLKCRSCLKKTSEESAMETLCTLAVKWVLANPSPIPLPEPPYKR